MRYNYRALYPVLSLAKQQEFYNVKIPRARIGQILGSWSTRDNGLISGKFIRRGGTGGRGAEAGLEGKHRGNWEKA